MSWKTVRRDLKMLGASFRRVLCLPARACNPRWDRCFAKALDRARLLCEQGVIVIMPGDESGFCLLPYVPYLTQGLSAQAHNQRVNAFGFWRGVGVEATHLFHRLVLDLLKSRHFILAVEEQLLPFLVRPTVLILDNDTAPWRVCQGKNQALESGRYACLVLEALLPASQSPGRGVEANKT